MKWLKIDYIKQHSRIDYDCEDGLLELYGESAEETVLNVIRPHPCVAIAGRGKLHPARPNKSAEHVHGTLCIRYAGEALHETGR